MNKQTVKKHLISAAITFVATFAFFFCGMIVNSDFNFSKDAFYAASLGALIAAVRALAKIIYEAAAQLLSSGE